MERDKIAAIVRSCMTEERFLHSLRTTEMAVSLAECHGVDTELAWKTTMLHDIAKDFSREKMVAIAQKYGHEISELSLRYPSNMHAEVGVLIAEHEFGLKDRDGLNAIRHHVTARPDMSTLEKIVYFSDSAEPGRPNQAAMQALYKVAKTDLDRAILRGLRILIDYQLSHNVPDEMCQICSEAFDFLLEVG